MFCYIRNWWKGLTGYLFNIVSGETQLTGCSSKHLDSSLYNTRVLFFGAFYYLSGLAYRQTKWFVIFPINFCNLATVWNVWVPFTSLQLVCLGYPLVCFTTCSVELFHFIYLLNRVRIAKSYFSYHMFDGIHFIKYPDNITSWAQMLYKFLHSHICPDSSLRWAFHLRSLFSNLARHLYCSAVGYL